MNGGMNIVLNNLKSENELSDIAFEEECDEAGETPALLQKSVFDSSLSKPCNANITFVDDGDCLMPDDIMELIKPKPKK